MHKKSDKSETITALRYTGNGAFLPGVPARDLTADEAREYDYMRLINSGIYQPITEA